MPAALAGGGGRRKLLRGVPVTKTLFHDPRRWGKAFQAEGTAGAGTQRGNTQAFGRMALEVGKKVKRGGPEGGGWKPGLGWSQRRQ